MRFPAHGLPTLVAAADEGRDHLPADLLVTHHVRPKCGRALPVDLAEFAAHCFYVRNPEGGVEVVEDHPERTPARAAEVNSVLGVLNRTTEENLDSFVNRVDGFLSGMAKSMGSVIYLTGEAPKWQGGVGYADFSA